MRVRVLGTMEVGDGRQWHAVPGQKCRAVLARLLAAAPDAVTLDQLVDEVWGEHPPKTAPTQIHAHVLKLRRLLDDADGRVLVTAKPGYRLDLGPQDVDAQVFEAAVTDGVTRLQDGEPAAAAAVLADALALWRGAALQDAPPTERVEAMVHRLEEIRLDALEARIDADLRCCRHGAVIGELRELVREQPLREELWRLLMVALYRSHRQAEAMQEYQRLRTVLVDELGTDPCPELQEVHQQVLEGTLPGAGSAGPASPTAGPDEAPEPDDLVLGSSAPWQVNQLPADVADFTGRQGQVDAVVDALTAAAPDGAPPVVVVHGAPGAGKSTLAVHAARRAADAFPDAQLYLDLRGTAQPARDAAELLGEMLRALGVVGRALPDGLEQRAAMLRSRLDGRRVLLVLDDADSAEQVRPLLPPDGGSAVLVSSRGVLTHLPGAQHVEVAALDAPEAHALLAQIVGAERVAAEPDEAAAIAEACGHLPLALRIAGGRLLSRPRWSLRVLRERLEDDSRRLSEMRLGDLDVLVSVESSLRGLPEDAVRAFDLLGLLDGDFPGWVVQPLLDDAAAEEVLERLVDANLVAHVGMDVAGQPRYRLHDLLRACAVQRCGRRSADETRGSVRRLLAGWLAALDHARDLLPPSLYDPPAQATDRLVVQDLDLARALENPLQWFAAERRQVLGAVGLAAQWQLGGLAWELASGAVTFYDARALYDDWEHSHRIALEACSGDTLGEAVLLRGLAQIDEYRLRPEEALERMSHSLGLFTELGHQRGMCLATLGLASLHRDAGDLDEAMELASRALEHLPPDRDLEAAVRCAGGRVLRARGEVDGARAWLDQALALARAGGDEHREALVLRESSWLQHQCHESRFALEGFRRALSILERLEDDRCAATVLLSLGQAHLDLDERADAAAVLNRAARLFEAVGSPDGVARCRQLMPSVGAGTG